MSSSNGLKRQVLPDEEFNCSAVTHTLLAAPAIGISSQAKTADRHYNYWTDFMEKTPFLEAIVDWLNLLKTSSGALSLTEINAANSC